MDFRTHLNSILNSQIVILGSWGYCNETIIENGIRFNVRGFLFSGIVKVILDADETYTVILERPEGYIYTRITGIDADNLISTIDTLVEKNCPQSEYEVKVKNDRLYRII